MMNLLSGIVILYCLIATHLVQAQIFVKVINNGDSSKLESFGNYSSNLKQYNDKMEEVEELLKMIPERYEKPLSNQKLALQKLIDVIGIEQEMSNPERPITCKDALSDGKPSGVYQLYLPESEDIEPFDVYCMADPNNGSAWTMVNRRQDGSVDFYRGWYDYKRGFGNLKGEFWIGLDKLHAITNQQEHELWIELEDFENEKGYARYSSFGIGNEAAGYDLRILGPYSGNRMDCMASHTGEKFTTRDTDNDKSESSNCAIDYTGGWWYRMCHDSNLNGQYLRAKNPDHQKGQGIEWYKWHPHYSLKYAHMAIRPTR